VSGGKGANSTGLFGIGINPHFHIKGGYVMDAWYTFIAEVGFPIAVTFYLLHRIEGKLNLLIDSIQQLPDKMK